MIKAKLNYLFFFFLIGILIPSCSQEENVVAEEFRTDRNDRPGGNGGNNGNGNNGGNQGNGHTLPVGALDSDLLEDWTDLLLELERYSEGRPNASARALAYIYLAAYETAVPGMDGYRSNDNRLSGLDLRRPNRSRDIDYELALNTTFAKVIDHFLRGVPETLNNRIETFKEEKETLLEQDLPFTISANSIQWGEYVADKIIQYSQTDTEAEAQILDPQPTSYEPPTGNGYWTYSADPERALFPYWNGDIRTFVISSEQTSSRPPLDYSTNNNSPYYQQMLQVMEENNRAREEQNDQLHIAEFWSDDVEGLMMSPPARQISITNQLVSQEDLQMDRALELFVKVGFSLNDAAVSAWADKYEYMVMRPSNFIHEFIDDSFQTNLYRLIYWPNPSFPGYPSGHSTFASAAAGVFIDFFGNDFQFTDRTHEGRTEFLSEPRSFNSFEQLADENGYSRIPLGVHVRMDCTEGLRLGYEISDAVNKINLGGNHP